MTCKTNLLLVASLLIANAASAQVQDPLCRLNQHQPKMISYLGEQPSYFAKVHPEGEFAFFIGSGNRILFLEEKDQSKRVVTAPGSIDPVPCPDGKILTVPGLTLYDMEAVLKDGENAKELLSDESNGGVYQSCAVLSTQGRYTTYRVITDSSGEVAFRDYKVRYSRSGRPPRVTPLKSMRYRCPKMNLKTLIISKTGKYLSAYIPDVGTTKIFDIEGEEGECKEVADIGYATGKLEFNFDDTQVAFHVDYFNSQAGEYFSGVSSDLSKDVFTLDIERSGEKLMLKNLRRLTTARYKGSGSYYPSYNRAGQVVFLNDDHNFYSFHVMQPQNIPFFSPVLPPPEGWPGGQPPEGVPADWKEKLHASAIVGSLWSKRCSADDEEFSAAEAASVKMVLPVSTCTELVNEYWKEGSAAELAQHVRFSRDSRFDPELIKLFNRDQLAIACKSTPEVNDPPPKVYGSKLSGRLDGPRAVQHYCVGCHVVGGRLRLEDGSTIPNTLDFNNLQPWQIEAALARLDLPAGQGRMPPSGFEAPSDGVDHKQIVKNYLECKLRQAGKGKVVNMSLKEDPKKDAEIDESLIDGEFFDKDSDGWCG